MNWQPVIAELERWPSSARAARFWLRDDDAVEPSGALDRLLDLTGRNDVPVLLAVIPAGVKDTLARRLEQADRVVPAVHGWAHANHAPAGEKKQELGPHRAQSVVLGELEAGLARLTDLFAERLAPLLVPPWNRIDPALVPLLGDIGYRALSAFGRKPLVEAGTGLVELNTHVDLIDWRGTRGCRNHQELIGCVAEELARSFEGDGSAVGILTHHLVHDENVDIFLQELFDLIAAHPAAKWARASDLIA